MTVKLSTELLNLIALACIRTGTEVQIERRRMAWYIYMFYSSLKQDTAFNNQCKSNEINSNCRYIFMYI